MQSHAPAITAPAPAAPVGADPSTAATPAALPPLTPAPVVTGDVKLLAAQFAAAVELSMSQSLAGLYDDSGDGDDAGGDDSGGDDLGVGGLDGLDLGGLTGASPNPALAATPAGGNSAQLQALFAALIGGGAQPATMTSASSSAEAQRSASLLGTVPGAAPATTPTTPIPTGMITGSADARGNAGVVAQVAREHGVDPVAAVAMMLVESGGNARATGDGGTSFGLFQLHEGGMLTSAGLTPQQAFDPRTNATVSITSLAREGRRDPHRTPGQIAAASQRPADPAGYARRVDAAMSRARELLSRSV